MGPSGGSLGESPWIYKTNCGLWFLESVFHARKTLTWPRIWRHRSGLWCLFGICPPCPGLSGLDYRKWVDNVNQQTPVSGSPSSVSFLICNDMGQGESHKTTDKLQWRASPSDDTKTWYKKLNTLLIKLYEQKFESYRWSKTLAVLLTHGHP